MLRLSCRLLSRKTSKPTESAACARRNFVQTLSRHSLRANAAVYVRFETCKSVETFSREAQVKFPCTSSILNKHSLPHIFAIFDHSNLLPTLFRNGTHPQIHYHHVNKQVSLCAHLLSFRTFCLPAHSHPLPHTRKVRLNRKMLIQCIARCSVLQCVAV